eukprot:jgi/Chlat1/1811/Chrsp135S02134
MNPVARAEATESDHPRSSASREQAPPREPASERIVFDRSLTGVMDVLMARAHQSPDVPAQDALASTANPTYNFGSSPGLAGWGFGTPPGLGLGTPIAGTIWDTSPGAFLMHLTPPVPRAGEEIPSNTAHLGFPASDAGGWQQPGLQADQLWNSANGGNRDDQGAPHVVGRPEAHRLMSGTNSDVPGKSQDSSDVDEPSSEAEVKRPRSGHEEPAAQDKEKPGTSGRSQESKAGRKRDALKRREQNREASRRHRERGKQRDEALRIVTSQVKSLQLRVQELQKGQQAVDQRGLVDHHRQQQERNLIRLRQLLPQMGDGQADTANSELALRTAVAAFLQDEDGFIQRWQALRATKQAQRLQTPEQLQAARNAVDPLMIDPEELLRRHAEGSHGGPATTEAPRPASRAPSRSNAQPLTPGRAPPPGSEAARCNGAASAQDELPRELMPKFRAMVDRAFATLQREDANWNINLGWTEALQSYLQITEEQAQLTLQIEKAGAYAVQPLICASFSHYGWNVPFVVMTLRNLVRCFHTVRSLFLQVSAGRGKVGSMSLALHILNRARPQWWPGAISANEEIDGTGVTGDVYADQEGDPAVWATGLVETSELYLKMRLGLVDRFLEMVAAGSKESFASLDSEIDPELSKWLVYGLLGDTMRRFFQSLRPVQQAKMILLMASQHGGIFAVWVLQLLGYHPGEIVRNRAGKNMTFADWWNLRAILDDSQNL